MLVSNTFFNLTEEKHVIYSLLFFTSPDTRGEISFVVK